VADWPEPRPGAVPFQEALDFFRAKLNVPTRAWTDLWQDQHAAGFMVAGAATADLVQELRDAVDRAIQGGGLDAFRLEFDGIVARHGWSYRGGRGWRTRVIFETNLRTAYSAGRWQQALATQQDRPFLRYVAVQDERTRPEHRAWHNTVLPIDDAWWKTHTPPNGWGCRCTFVSVSERDLERNPGWKQERPEGWDTTVERVVPGKGAVEVPEGIDPGFAYNPGAAGVRAASQRQAAARMVHGKLAAYDPDMAAAVAAAFPAEVTRAAAEEYRGWARGVLAGERPDGELRVLGALSPQVLLALARRGVTPEASAIVVTARSLGHMARETKVERGRAVAEADLLALPEIVAEPEQVLRSRVDGSILLIFTPSNPEEARRGKVAIELDRAQKMRGLDGRRERRLVHSVRTAGLVAAANLEAREEYDDLGE
jgi:SPP1 gp7 family putative phage head morphogenesis protein